jgi:hypothetical protein
VVLKVGRVRCDLSGIVQVAGVNVCRAVLLFRRGHGCNVSWNCGVQDIWGTPYPGKYLTTLAMHGRARIVTTLRWKGQVRELTRDHNAGRDSRCYGEVEGTSAIVISTRGLWVLGMNTGALGSDTSLQGLLAMMISDSWIDGTALTWLRSERSADGEKPR